MSEEEPLFVWIDEPKPDDRPADSVMLGHRFYARVGPDSGWLRDIPRATIRRQRWRWSVNSYIRRDCNGRRYRVEAEGHAPSKKKARACAEGVLKTLEDVRRDRDG